MANFVNIGAGMVIWAIGFVFESVGDWQLKEFIKNKSNKGMVMDKGLWRYTRHPNYFGEVVMWWGIWVASLGNGGWWTIVGPMTISCLIIFVSGIPLLENKMQKNKNYQEYMKRTSMFLPWPPKHES
jgi:steroid 5-alpha reductase family enzyme